MNYDDDVEWHEWNLAAKQRILMRVREASIAKPLPPTYYIDQFKGNGSAKISSLGSNSYRRSDPLPVRQPQEPEKHSENNEEEDSVNESAVSPPDDSTEDYEVMYNQIQGAIG
jgi:hypothetical protein